jgi:hypothetical protein
MEIEEHQENEVEDEAENEAENEAREEEGGENESDHQNEHMSTDDDEEETDDDVDMELAPGRNGSNGWANRLGGGHTLTDEPVGDTEMTNASNEEAEPIADRRSHMLSAIQQRTGTSSSGSDNKVVKPHIKRKVKSLKDICATLVTGIKVENTSHFGIY